MPFRRALRLPLVWPAPGSARSDDDLEGLGGPLPRLPGQGRRQRLPARSAAHRPARASRGRAGPRRRPVRPPAAAATGRTGTCVGAASRAGPSTMAPGRWSSTKSRVGSMAWPCAAPSWSWARAWAGGRALLAEKGELWLYDGDGASLDAARDAPDGPRLAGAPARARPAGRGPTRSSTLVFAAYLLGGAETPDSAGCAPRHGHARGCSPGGSFVFVEAAGQHGLVDGPGGHALAAGDAESLRRPSRGRGLRTGRGRQHARRASSAARRSAAS